jgi:hypothetical protein
MKINDDDKVIMNKEHIPVKDFQNKGILFNDDTITKKKKSLNTSKVKAVKEEVKTEVVKDKVLIRQVESEKIEPEKNLVPFNDVAKNKSKFTYMYWKNKIKFMNKNRTIIINMELINGMHKTFQVYTNAEGFLFNGGRYVFDESLAYYNIDFRCYCFDFHERFCLPIKKKLPYNDIQEIIDNIGCEIEYATNPITLERFMVSKVAEGVMKGQAFDEFIRRVQMVLIIILVVVMILLILFVWKTGMLENVNLF